MIDLLISDIAKQRFLTGELKIETDEYNLKHFLPFCGFQFEYTDGGLKLSFLDKDKKILVTISEPIPDGSTCTVEDITGRIQVNLEKA